MGEYIERLKNCQNTAQLGSILRGVSVKQFMSIQDSLINKPDSLYSEFTIPKKGGEERTIQAPCKELKQVQRGLAHLLGECLSEISRDRLAENRKTRELSHGFRKGCSIHTNAEMHIKKRHVFNVDIEDFFPSIHFGRVRGYFVYDRRFELSEKIAAAIARVACYRGVLPQGSPCSPVISNLIANTLDMYMVSLAREHGCTYSRYADDLTFSTNQKKFPSAIALQQVNYPDKWTAGNRLDNQVGRAGFSINPRKTRMSYRQNRQTVTGLVVNRKTNISIDYYRLTRVLVHRLLKEGDYTLPPGKASNKVRQDVGEHDISKKIARLDGRLNHIYHTREVFNRNDGERSPCKPGKSMSGIKRLYSDFLFFKYFIAQDKPLIICEGNTDSGYIRRALKGLHDHKKYSLLIDKEKGNFVYKVKFFRYPEKTEGHPKKAEKVRELMGIGGGADDLRRFVQAYRNHQFCGSPISKITTVKPRYPVIIVVDNDDKGREVFTPLVKGGMRNIDEASNALHVRTNLYVVVLPRNNGEENTTIENLLSEETLTRYNYNGGEEEKHEMFREVMKNWRKEDFTGFKGLLNLFEGVIQDFERRKSRS